MHYEVLIVDDEIMLANMTAEYFNAFNVKTGTVATAEECLNFLKDNEIDLILLDINLIGSSGFDLCKTIRENYDTPIFFISARISTDDMMIALNIGGDDYITKPYELNVLLAKIKARLKREKIRKEAPNTTTINNIKIDHAKMKAYIYDTDLELKPKEFKLLNYLISNKNQIVTKDDILNNVWGDNFITDGALTVQISRLREKIEKNSDNLSCIKTIWGQGYIFETNQ